MRRSIRKGMNQRKIFLAGVLLYGGASFFPFVQNALSAEKIIEKGKTKDHDGRAALRAFYTAPPVIPHEVESRDSRDCLLCHSTTLKDGWEMAQTPHPPFSNCLQCHAPSLPGGDLEVANAWKGLEEPQRDKRWAKTSPPTVPHRIFMRENCLVCHGPDNSNMRLKTPHPERASCLQCHALKYNREF